VGAATPGVSLFCLGASLVGFNLAAGWRQMSVTVVAKLLLLPAMVFCLCRLLGLSDLEVAVTTTIASLPTGANAFLMSNVRRIRRSSKLAHCAELPWKSALRI
jgi:predicted permease